MKRSAGDVLDDPNVRVGIEMPASVYQRLRQHAAEHRVSLSKLCRDGALRELDRGQED